MAVLSAIAALDRCNIVLLSLPTTLPCGLHVLVVLSSIRVVEGVFDHLICLNVFVSSRLQNSVRKAVASARKENNDFQELREQYSRRLGQNKASTGVFYRTELVCFPLNLICKFLTQKLGKVLLFNTPQTYRRIRSCL